MKREIKFRGKRVDNSEWVFGLLSETDCINVLVIDNSVGFRTHDYYQVIPETVGQFTGLQDKNGKDIFEGDKIHIWGGTEFNGMFEYDYRGICEFMGAEFCVNSKNCCIGFGNLEYCEVIGNIYDNPELLK